MSCDPSRPSPSVGVSGCRPPVTCAGTGSASGAGSIRGARLLDAPLAPAGDSLGFPPLGLAVPAILQLTAARATAGDGSMPSPIPGAAPVSGAATTWAVN